MNERLRQMVGNLYGKASQLRRSAYDRGYLRKLKLKAKVVSVGNLTMGGTGKTPVVLWLARELSKKGKKIAIVSRNYKAEVRGIAQVDPSQEEAASYYGDEPALLAKGLSDVPVFVGPRKSETAAWAEMNEGPFDLILIDDGFQHMALHRDLEVVLIDATDRRSFDVVPLGRAREGREELQRADLILLTKVNWASVDQGNYMRSFLPDGVPVVEVGFKTCWPEIDGEGPIGVFSGLARNEIFADQARKKYFGRVTKIWSHPDHHAYSARDWREMKEFLASVPGAALITTEKDAVKILDPDLRSQVRTVTLELEFSPEGVFFDRVWDLVR